MFLLLFVFAVHLSTCHVIDVEYRDKVVSDHKGDGFGVSLATSHHKLVIGAPWGGGSVMVDEGVRVKGPEGSFRFGSDVDVNQYFMVVSGYDNPSFVYVYQSYSPYNMVTWEPLSIRCTGRWFVRCDSKRRLGGNIKRCRETPRCVRFCL